MSRRPDPSTADIRAELFGQFLSDTAMRTAWMWLHDHADPAAAAEAIAAYVGDKTDPAYVELQAAITAAGGSQ